MLSYRHAYHAGNFADVHKHVALTAALQFLQAKERGYLYVDTHAGAGRYAVGEDDARRLEWREGVARIMAAVGGLKAAVTAEKQAPAMGEEIPSPVSAWLAAVTSAGWPEVYPGSPALAEALARRQDRALLLELHPQDGAALKAMFRQRQQVAVHAPRDAREGVSALLPPKDTPRGLVLIDPSYERVEEYADTADLLVTARRRWPTASVMVWYPLLGGPRAGRHRVLLDKIARDVEGAVWRSEICVHDTALPGLAGSGMLVARPPWPFQEHWPRVSQWLAERLVPATDPGSPTTLEVWLKHEGAPGAAGPGP